MAKTPRGYQVEAYESVINYDGDREPLLVVGTGLGKTFIGMMVVKTYLEQGRRVLWVADRKELLLMEDEEGRVVGGAAEAAEEAGLTYGICMADAERDIHSPLVLAMKASLRRGSKRLSRLLTGEGFDLMVCDEAHHTPSAGWVSLIEDISPARRLGLTATPDRADNRRLSDLWDIAYSYPMMDGIRDGYSLTPYASVARPPKLDLSKVRVTRGDYSVQEAEAAMYSAHIMDHLGTVLDEEHTFSRLPFRDETITTGLWDHGGVLVYCLTVEMAHAAASVIADGGRSVAVVYGGMDKSDRRSIISEFKAGLLKCIVNVGVLTEGTDLPIASVAVLIRPTASWSLFIQILGRLLRLHDGQSQAFLLDLVGASKHHSIVSAPVLVDGRDCPESEDGKHRFLPLPSGEGRCQNCGHVVKCHANKGGHVFKGGECECGASQCPNAPDHQHHPVPWEPGVRRCIYCGVDFPDPISSLVDRPNPPRIPVEWKKLADMDVWAAHLGEIGILFRRLIGEEWKAYWWANGRLQPLHQGTVCHGMCRLLTQDVARRAARVNGVYGARRSPKTLERAMREAKRVALKESV